MDAATLKAKALTYFLSAQAKKGITYKEDTEMAKLKYLQGINDIVSNFQSEVESASDQFLQVGLAKDEAKSAELIRAVAEKQGYKGWPEPKPEEDPKDDMYFPEE